MEEPSVRTSRLAIAGGLAAVIAIGGAGFFLGRTSAPTPRAPAPVATTAPTPTPTPQAARVFRRADLIALAEGAADALASGKPLPEDVVKAADRRFELVMPFGCAGPGNAGGDLNMQWSYEEDAEALHLSVPMARWRAADWNLEGNAGTATDANSDAIAAEGFWITRPWTSSEACPARAGRAVPTGIDAITLPGQTLAIAQFSATDAQRGGRPFETVKRVPADRLNNSRGFRLHVTGRITRTPAGTPVRCIQPAGIEQRPICVIGVRLDEVRIENPATTEILATWPMSRKG